MAEGPQTSKTLEMPKTGGSLWALWTSSNIFDFQIWDCFAYLLFYIIIPIIITLANFANYPKKEGAPVIYFYVSILISALNCAYDARNRMRSKPSFRNNKLGVMCGGATVAAMYCGGVSLWVMVTETSAPRGLDALLLAYLVVIAVALGDTIMCLDDRWKRNTCFQNDLIGGE